MLDFTDNSRMMVTMPDLNFIRKVLEDREREVTEKEREIRNLRAELEKDKQAFARVLEILPEQGELAQMLEASLASPRGIRVKDAVLTAVHVVGKTLPVFSSSHVFDYLAGLSASELPGLDLDKNRANISAYMRDLVTQNVLQTVEVASGRRPAMYKLKSSPPVNNNSSK